MARPRKYTLPELLVHARDAVQANPTVHVKAFIQQIGGGTTREVHGALKAAKWEHGLIAGDAEAVLDPGFLDLVGRDSRRSSPGDLDLAAPPETLLAPVTDALGAVKLAFERVLTDITETAVRRIADERRRADDQAAAAAEHEHGLGVSVDQLGRELAEVQREAAIEQANLRQEVALQAQELRSLHGQLDEARAGLQTAETARARAEQERAQVDEARAREDRAATEERAASNARYEAELREARELIGRSEARADALQAQVVDLQQRLTEAAANLDRALEAGAKARAEAAAAKATLEEARTAHAKAVQALDTTIEELRCRFEDAA